MLTYAVAAGGVLALELLSKSQALYTTAYLNLYICWRMLTYAGVCWRMLSPLEMSSLLPKLQDLCTAAYLNLYTKPLH